MTEPTVGFVGDRAAAYDRRAPQVIPGYDILHRLVEVVLAEDLPEVASLLVVGAGTGEEIARLAKGHASWRFTAIDPSVDMVTRGQKRMKEAGVEDRVQWHVGTLDDFTPQGAYDAALALLVLHFVPKENQLSFLSAISDGLNPGAPLILAGVLGDSGTTRFKRLQALTRAWALTSGMEAKEAAELFDAVRPDFHPFTEESLKAMLREAGFIDIQRFYQALRVGAWLARTNR